MADEIITLVSKEYATGNFQSKLTEANEGDNIKITGEGDNLKISAEVPAPGQTTITTSDERVAVTETQTGYDLALNGSFIERGEYTELENTVDGHTASITALGGTVATVQEDVGTLNSTVTSLEHDVEGNKEAITDLENTVENKQDKLSWYRESEDYPYTVDIASNTVMLRSGGDTVGIILDDTMLKLENGIHINTTVGDNVSKNILSTVVWPDDRFFITLGGQNAPIMCNGTLYGFGGGEHAAIEADSDTGGCNYFRMIASAWDYQTSISLSSIMGTGSITIAIGSTTLELTEEKLQKLAQLLES